MSSTLFSSDWPFGIDLPLMSAYDRLRLRANKNPIIIITTIHAGNPLSAVDVVQAEREEYV
jgi:hypothetical protein